MKLHFLYTLLITTQFAFGQFADSVSQITFQYNKGHYSFGKSGLYSIGEMIEYTKSADNEYRITSYLKFKKHFDSVTNTITVDTFNPTIPQKSISAGEVNKLFIELNRSQNNFNAAYVKPYLKAPTKKEIHSVAKKYDLDWMFDNEYSDRSERREIYKAIRQFQMLDSFLLSRKPNPYDDLLITDIWNVLDITYHQHQDTIQYRSQYFQLYGQPVIKHVNRDYYTRQGFVNLEINTLINKLLPKNSYILRATNLNQVKPAYIKWMINTEM